MNNINDKDDIETLRNENKKTNISDAKRKELRKEVEEIISRQEKEERRKRLELMEHLYESGFYA